MSLVVYLEARTESFPGHMVVGEESPSVAPFFYGFRFQPSDLPNPCHSVDDLKMILMSNAVPGYVQDESEYVGLLLSASREERNVFTKRRDGSSGIRGVLPPESEWKNYAKYSFNPHNFHSDEHRCYNCVTWATSMANAVCPDFLEFFPDGRVKKVIALLVPYIGTLS